MKHLLLLFSICLVVSGCATSARTEFIDADGTSFKATAKAGPFGQLDTTNQHLVYKWNATDGHIGVGNEAQGLDNSGQVVALEAGVGAVTDLVKVLGPLLAVQKLPGTGPVQTPDLLDKYERLCLLLCRIAPEQANQLCGCE